MSMNISDWVVERFGHALAARFVHRFHENGLFQVIDISMIDDDDIGELCGATDDESLRPRLFSGLLSAVFQNQRAKKPDPCNESTNEKAR